MSKSANAVLAVLFSVIAPMAAATPTISASPGSVQHGGSIAATWSGIANPTATDWVAWKPQGGACCWGWAYTTGTASGSVPLSIDVGSQGTFELVLYANDTYTVLASTTFNVFVENASVSAIPTSIAASGTVASSVSVTWSGVIHPTPEDWLALYPAGALNWEAFLGYGNGSASGTLPVTVPEGIAPGAYEIRLMSNGTTTVLGSTSFTITTPPENATVAITPTAVQVAANVGNEVQVTWSGISDPTTNDWLGLYAVGEADQSYLGYQWTSGAGSGSSSFHVTGGIPPGAYELRLFSNDSYVRLGRSNSFTVSAANIMLSASPNPVYVDATTSGVVSVNWNGIHAPTSTDWIGLRKVGQTLVQSWIYTNGAASGSLPYSIPAGTQAGAYELRLYSNDSNALLASTQLTLTNTPIAQLFYIEVDHLNTPREIYDASQQLRWKWEQQEPFGDSPPDSNPSGLGVFKLALRFAGQYFDEETGSADNWHRTYAATLGRYQQSDPLGLGGGLNTFAYAQSSPVDIADPTGLFAGYVHRSLSFEAAVVAGCSVDFADRVGVESLLADWKPTFRQAQSVANANQHGMSMPRQNPKQAFNATSAFIAQQISSCTPTGLGRALHAAQDIPARGHNFSTYNGSVNWSHFLGDFFPLDSELNAARQRSRRVLNQFLQACPCACRGGPSTELLSPLPIAP